ncbi:diguanylate cyclase [Rheinheimera riviphila]|uniref:diguanylate cyclase n=1 Tax=Rheinheimera riviphila TaxID=1834037 RepID=A0A437R4P2_9GAMM|nr:diguanylate cyclase [Rheinheimera riviphila]RVU41748.1 diguanylate cyclase [Rheinheimera riviphila]
MSEPLVLELFWSETGEQKSVRLELDQQPLTIGRAPGNQLVLEDASVSRQHAEIVLTPQGVMIKDTGSRFGTLLDQQLLIPGKAMLLAKTVELQFGTQKVQLKLQHEDLQEQEFAIWALHELQQKFENIQQQSLLALHQVSQDPTSLVLHQQQLQQHFQQVLQQADTWSAQNTLLQQLNTLLNQTQGHQALLQQAMPLIANVLGAERGFVLMFEPREQRFQSYAVYQYEAISKPELTEQTEFSLLLARHSYQQRALLVIDQTEQLSTFRLATKAVPAGCCSLLVVPLIYGDEVLAVLYLDHQTQHGAFSTVQQTFLQTLQQQLALALKSAISLSRALTDDLTGVYSRNMMEEQITLAMDQAKRYGHPCSLLFLDIDNFKQINDQHGHLVGDEVLKRIGRLLQDVARNSDVVGRLGGEEFVLLVTGTALEGATVYAERIRQDIAKLQLKAGTTAVKVTASIGVACYHLPLHNLAYRFIECADQAMYQAKHLGKNRVCVYQPNHSPQQDTALDLLRFSLQR